MRVDIVTRRVEVLSGASRTSYHRRRALKTRADSHAANGLVNYAR